MHLEDLFGKFQCSQQEKCKKYDYKPRNLLNNEKELTDKESSK